MVKSVPLVAAVLALALALAAPGRAETPVLAYEFPTETFVFPMDLLIEARAAPMVGGEPGLIATFGPGLAQGPVTARNVGRKVIVRICGEEVARPVIQTEIGGNTVVLPLSDPADAPRLAAILNARTCTVPAGS